MNERLRVAVVGCGAISKEHLHVLATHPRADLVGVCDRSPAAVKWTAERYATVGFADLASMLDATGPDIVHVLTPPSTHRVLAEQSLDAGAHVLVEKPIAESAAALAAMYDCAHRNGRHLIENYNYLFNDQMVRVSQLQVDGVLGEIAGVDVLLALDLTNSKLGAATGNPTSHLAGGAVRDFLTHITYLGLHPFGQAPVGRVDARWWNRSANPHIGADDFVGTAEVGQGLATVRFRAQVAPDCFRVWVRGSEASVEIDLFQPFVRLESRRGPKQLSPVINHAVNGAALFGSGVRNLKDKVLQKSPYHGLWTLLDRLIDALLDGGEVPVTEHDVRRTNAVIEQFVASAVAEAGVDEGVSPMRAFVTGASGFLGSSVVGAMVARGHQVTRLVRREDGFRHPQVLDAHGDIGHPSTWEAALGACDLVIHLAAAKGGDFSTQFASTVLGTETLLGAMSRVGVSRLIHVSSFSVYDYAALGVNDVLDERSPLEAHPLERDAYAQTKLLQEQLVREFATAGGAVTIIRPGGVYGTGNLWNGGMAMVLPGGVGVAYAPFGRLKFTYVENCAEAIALAAERRGSVGAVINIVDDDPPTQRAFARAMRRNGLTLPRGVVVPYRVARLGARMLQVANRVFFGGRAKLPGVIVPAKLDAQFKPLHYPNAEAHHVLGWRPRYSLDEALRRCRTGADHEPSVDRDAPGATC